jgi:hypothetical protein
MRVIVVGLKYFGKRIRCQLQEFDTQNQYIYLDTYYSLKDKLKYLFLLPFSSTVYSINGTTRGSKALLLAIKLKKRIVFHWVGSDLLQAQKDVSQKLSDKRFIDYPTHITDTPWFVDQLGAIGINAKYKPLLIFDTLYKFVEFPQSFGVLIYISKIDPDFYGFSRLILIAKQLPEIKFYIVGLENDGGDYPENIIFLGWVRNMQTAFEKAVITIRIPNHDGLSFFVLESLINKRYVLYSQKLNHCTYVVNNEQIINEILNYYHEFVNQRLLPNQEGYDFVSSAFTKDQVLKPLVDLLTH